MSVGAPCFAQGLAARLIGCECGDMIIGGPAGELGPFDRLELAVREFERFFGRCSTGRETLAALYLFSARTHLLMHPNLTRLANLLEPNC
jgi:hypothetical protein